MSNLEYLCLTGMENVTDVEFKNTFLAVQEENEQEGGADFAKTGTNFPLLETLQIRGFDQVKEDTFIEAIMNLPKITTLYLLGGFKLSEEGKTVLKSNKPGLARLFYGY